MNTQTTALSIIALFTAVEAVHAQRTRLYIDDYYIDYVRSRQSLAVVDDVLYAGGRTYDPNNLSFGPNGEQPGTSTSLGRAYDEITGNSYVGTLGFIYNPVTNAQFITLLNGTSSIAAFDNNLMEVSNNLFGVQNTQTGQYMTYNNFFNTTRAVRGLTAENINGEMHLFYSIGSEVLQARVLGNLYDGSASLETIQTYYHRNIDLGLITGVDLYNNNTRIAFATREGLGASYINIIPAPASGTLLLTTLALTTTRRRRT